MAALQDEQVVVDGVRSRVLVGGDPSAREAVVLVHGNPGSAEHWRDLAERLSSSVRVVAPDMPGFGEADKPSDFPYSIEGCSRHLDGVLSSLGVERAHLVLHDIGGLIGMDWAADQFDRVGSLTLVDTGVLRDYRVHALARVWRTRGLGELAMKAVSRRTVALALKRGQPRPLPDSFVDRLHADLEPAETRRAVLAFYRSVAVGPLGEKAHRRMQPYDGPVLVVWGGGDVYVDVRHAQRQKETFRQAEVVVLERSGHYPYADDPDGFAAAVVPFLERATDAQRGAR